MQCVSFALSSVTTIAVPCHARLYNNNPTQHDRFFFGHPVDRRDSSRFRTLFRWQNQSRHFEQREKSPEIKTCS